MKCLEFQRRRGDSRKFVIKAEILFTTPQFAGISNPGFHMLDEMQEVGTKHLKVKCAANAFFFATGPLSFLLGQLIGFCPITKEEYILKG